MLSKNSIIYALTTFSHTNDDFEYALRKASEKEIETAIEILTEYKRNGKPSIKACERELARREKKHGRVQDES